MAKPVKHGDKWRVRWIDAAGKRQSATFDEYKTAQIALSRHQVEAEEVKRGVRVAPPPVKTFDELCDYWLEKRAPRKRSGRNDASILKKLRAMFGGRKLRDLGVEDGDDYLAANDHLSEKTLANHITLLITMLRMATTFKVPWLLSVPKFTKPKVALFSRDYRWLRSDEEIRRFLTAAREEGDEYVSRTSARCTRCVFACSRSLRSTRASRRMWTSCRGVKRGSFVRRSSGGSSRRFASACKISRTASRSAGTRSGHAPTGSRPCRT